MKSKHQPFVQPPLRQLRKDNPSHIGCSWVLVDRAPPSCFAGRALGACPTTKCPATWRYTPGFKRLPGQTPCFMGGAKLTALSNRNLCSTNATTAFRQAPPCTTLHPAHTPPPSPPPLPPPPAPSQSQQPQPHPSPHPSRTTAHHAAGAKHAASLGRIAAGDYHSLRKTTRAGCLQLAMLLAKLATQSPSRVCRSCFHCL